MKRLKVLSLAALVAFAACDEGSEPVVPPTPTGTISGVVTIEGKAASGVSVALSSGSAATTDASGAFSFAGVNAGTYTVTISGFASDATFSTTTKGATITTSGQVVTVNFDGAYVRTSAIMGSVTAGGKGIAGVKVAIDAASTMTDASGNFSFTGLRKGTYTVTISGFDAAQYTFATTSASITVGVGETKAAPFTGTLVATAKITGTVKIDGTAAAGVTATLSTGATTTTDAAGAFSFSNLTAGSYTVTISGFAADATFTSVAKTVTITTAGSTATANFDGAYVKTSSIAGIVTVAGSPLAGVKVTVGSSSVNTDTSGQYSFAGLRAGTYTVTISDWNAAKYTFATTTASVTVAAGESKVASFAGAHVATAKINGSLYIDEVASNGTFDSTEDKLAVAGIVIEAEGGAVNNKVTTTTDANGDYSFTGLVGGTYRVSILGVTGAPLNTALPGNVAFRATAATSQLVTVETGATGTAHWPFNITQQAVKAFAFLGTDGVAPGKAPIKGVTLQLYDTYANAINATATGQLKAVATDASGVSTFRFSRSADVGPSGGVDNIVFARLSPVTLPANYVLNGETVIEIKYNTKDSLVMAPDTFDALNSQIVFKIKAQEIDGDKLAGWTAQMRFVPDTTTASLVQSNSNSSGYAFFTVNRAAITALHPTNADFPDTISTRLADALQPNVYPFTQAASATRGSVAGRYLRYVWDGTVPASDTVDLGAHSVTYSQATIVARAHREQDDTLGYTAGDGLSLINTLINVQLYEVKSDGSKVSVVGPVVPAADGTVTFTNILTGKNFELRARSTDAGLKVLTDTVVSLSLNGAAETYTDATLKGSAGNSTFAVKAVNNRISGVVQARDGTPAAGLKVRVTATAGNIQGTKDTTVVTNAAGAFATLYNLIEGPYTVSVADSTTSSGSVWSFSTKLLTTTVTAPVSIGGSGAANNTDARTGTRDVQGSGVSPAANFLADRMDTKIQGVIANDRDADQNTIDPEEGLGNVTVQLYKDNSGTITVSSDSLVATATTDANGAFVFPGLPEGTYIVKPVAVSNAVILRGLTNGDTAIVRTAAGYTTVAGVCGVSANWGNPDASINPAGCDGRTVGVTTGFSATVMLPAWNYATSTYNLKSGGQVHRQPHFTFLYNTGTATGVVTKTGVAKAGMTISAVKCQTVAPGVRGVNWTSPPTIPVAGGTTCTPVGSAINVATDTNGVFTFTGLQEGLWYITANPATAGLADAVTSGIFEILGNNDVETGNFVFP